MFEIINYSEKAIAVKGDTKTIKEQLKSLGGRFNPRLKTPENQETRFAGWIFPKTKEDALRKALNLSS